MDRPQQLGSIWPIPEVAKRNRNEDEKDERRGLDDRHHLEALELFELDARYLCMVIVRILSSCMSVAMSAPFERMHS